MERSKKIKVGEYACGLDDPETGALPLGVLMNIPAEALHYSFSCNHQNNNYTACRCDYGSKCDFQKEVTEKDQRDYPDLFEEEEDDI